MESKSIFFEKLNKPKKTILGQRLNKRKFSIVLGIMMMFSFSIKTAAQTTLVVPDSNEGSVFIGPYGNAARQLQMITMIRSLLPSSEKTFLHFLQAAGKYSYQLATKQFDHVCV